MLDDPQLIPSTGKHCRSSPDQMRIRRGRHQHGHSRLSSRSFSTVIWFFFTISILYYQGISWTVNTMNTKPSKQIGPIEPTKLFGKLKTAFEKNDFVPRVDKESLQVNKVVHIVHTRFMQHQPSLSHLGEARIELFREFALQSLNRQASSNFLWVIRTDPELDPMLRKALIELLSNVDNHILIASNENPNIQIEEILTVTPSNVWSGNFAEAKSYLQRAKHRSQKVLETRLDADDALSDYFIHHLQDRAVSELSSQSGDWKIWCAANHLEWQSNSITDNVEENAGILLSLNDGVCISAGLTVGYTPGTKNHDLPPMKHQKLKETLPLCVDDSRKCLDFIQMFPTALRARTPTSAGMMNIILGQIQRVDKRYLKGAKKQEKLQTQIWSVATPRFGFHPQNASHLKEYLRRNLVDISKDNLAGQCSDGHSCKESSRALLQSIIDHPENFV